MANCNNNGKTFVVSLTPISGGTIDDSNYILALEHFTCGNRRLCVTEAYPVTADLKYRVVGSPIPLGNDTYCCELLVTGTCTYMPYNGGCNCNQCPRTENIYCNICVPCANTTAPVVTTNDSVATPTNIQPCCSLTNAIAITSSFNVTSAATQTTNP